MKPTLFLLLATAASAQTAADLAFQKYDADQDGKVTSSELSQVSVFKRFDLNSDGHITLEETRSVMGGSETSSSMPTDLNQGRKLWQRLDQNKDGKLTRDEVPQSTVFARFDLNNDGTSLKKKASKSSKRPSNPPPSLRVCRWSLPVPRCSKAPSMASAGRSPM
jgi:hypothetical protein